MRKPFFIDKDDSKSRYTATFQAKKYAGTPTRKLTISCDSNPMGVWGTGFFPRCTSEGTFVEVKFQGQHGVQITLDNGKTLEFQSNIFALPSSGYMSSNGRSVEFTIAPTK